MNRNWLTTVEREYEAQGIDLQEEGITNDEIAELMTIVLDVDAEQQGTIDGHPICISEDLFGTIISLIHETAPKLTVPFLLHCDTETEELFLNPILFRYIIQQGKAHGMTIEFAAQLVDAMPLEYAIEILDELAPENSKTPARNQSQQGFDAL